MAELTQTSAKAGSARTAKKLTARVDLTAMVDLAFLLVTFFMLTTRLDKPRVMNLTMPDPGPEVGIPESRTLTLCIGKNNQLVYYRGSIQKPVDGPRVVDLNKGGLRQVLLGTAKKVKEQTAKPMMVLVKPGIHAVYGNLVNTIDELNITNNNIYAVTDISTEDNKLLKQKMIY